MSATHEGPVVLIVGTRPEGIKMAPVYWALKRAGIPTCLVSTMQHDELLREVLDLFGIVPDVELGIMRHGQDLFYLTQSVLQKTKEVFNVLKPSRVLVQGDTTSSMAAALAAFYLQIPVGHVEAGLRTDDVLAPFPEEMNRRLISVVASYHFAPTPASSANILGAGVPNEDVFCTGNTVVDALAIIKERIFSGALEIRDDIKSYIGACHHEGRQIAVLTIHRRESFSSGILKVLQAVKEFVEAHKDIFWIYPYHPNPQVINAIDAVGLANTPNLYLTEPLLYKDMVYLLDSADFVLTDSGGIQEEVISLGKPVLVLREKTERMEGVLAGCARIVGFDQQKIASGIEWAMEADFSKQPHIKQIYGDGHAAEKIVAFIQARDHNVLVGASCPLPVEKAEAKKNVKKELNVKKVCVIGLGYIGLPTAIVLAEKGFEVVGYDIDADRVEKINAGNPVIHEPEVFEKLQLVLSNKKFKASEKISISECYVIAVPTPITDQKKADVSCVMEAGKTVAGVLKKGDLVLLESTVPVGTTGRVSELIEQESGLKAHKDFYIAYCPERVLPGKIFHELESNDRIIGAEDHKDYKAAKSFYESFVSGSICGSSIKVAEMVKLVENTSRDIDLAFAHQVSSMARSIGLNPYEVIDLANKHPRVNILRPTCGVGGHCLAVDPWFLVESFPQQSALIKAARDVNDDKREEVINAVLAQADRIRQEHQRVPKVFCLGLTYKANVDDLRESPALYIAEQLTQKNDVTCFVHDPFVSPEKMDKLFANHAKGLVGGLSQADIVLFLVAHDRFKVIDQKLLEGKYLFDFCGILFEAKKRMQESEAIFWPARSMMDFFIVNQAVDADAESVFINEDT